MKVNCKNLTIAIFFLLPFCQTISYGQNINIKLTLADSIKITHPNTAPLLGYISKEGNQFKFITTENFEVFYYDLNGKLVERLNFASEFNGRDIRVFPIGVTKMKSGYFLYDNLLKKFYYLNSSRQLVDRKRLKTWINGKNYFIRSNMALLNYQVDLERELIPLPIKYKWKGVYHEKKHSKGGEKFYSTPGLIGLFNKEGKIVKTIGSYDKIYQEKKFLSYLDDIYYFYSIEKGKIFIGQEATHRIQAFDVDSDYKLRVFGNQGKFIKTPPEALVEVKNHEETPDLYNKLCVESPEYKGIYYHDSLDLVLRYYKTKVEDTSSVDSIYLQLRADYNSGKLQGCPAPSKQILQQAQLIKSKKNYLQIYSGQNDYQLIYDKPIEIISPFIIGESGAHIYIRSLYPDDDNPETITIYKYKIDVENRMRLDN